MNKIEFKDRIYKLGFNLKQFAEHINTPYSTIRSYSNGANPIPGTVVRLLELLEKNQDLEEENQELKALLEKINETIDKFSSNN